MSDSVSLRALPSLATTSIAITTGRPNTEKPPPSSPTTASHISKHKERHTLHSDFLRDAIIGFSDGLTVPFALCAALSTLDSSKVVISGGLAELFAGSLSMGIGAVLASLNEKTHFKVEQAREVREVREDPAAEEEEIYDIFAAYGVARPAAKGVVAALKSDEVMWVQFMMDFELKLTKPSTKKAPIEGLVMGAAYFFGGLLPMIPYFAIQHSVQLALYVSIAITVVVTLIFGWLKAQFIKASHLDCFKSALLTLLLCGVATGVSYGIVWAVDHHGLSN